MRRLSQLLILATVGALLLAAGLGVGQLLASRGETTTFRTATVESGSLKATISASGVIEPEEVIDVGAQVAAQIKFFGRDPNDSSKPITWRSQVHEGTLLVQLDDSLFKARVAQCKASVEEASAAVMAAEANVQRAMADLDQMRAKVGHTDADWTRAQKLGSGRAITDADADLARAAYDTARANLRVGEAAIAQAKAAKLQAEKTLARVNGCLHEAEVNLSYTQIRSPVEGVIVDRRVNVGQTVVAGLNAPSLFLIAKDLKRLQVWASVNEADIGNIHAGQPVHFTVDAYPREVFTGSVEQIRLNATMTNNVVTYTVVVATDNAHGKLLPYMTANLRFDLAQHDNVLLVPNAALRWRPQFRQVEPASQEVYTRLLKRKHSSAAEDKAAARASHESGLVWVLAEDGESVRPIRVRIGLSDGVNTEIIGGGLEPGTHIILGEVRSGDAGDPNPFTPKMFSGGVKKLE